MATRLATDHAPEQNPGGLRCYRSQRLGAGSAMGNGAAHDPGNYQLDLRNVPGSSFKLPSSRAHLMQRKSLAAPRNTRNGLKWRDGRPRWEASPTNRAAGLRGVDLRVPDGRWLSRGEAIDICDSRTLWAQAIREALTGGPAGADAFDDIRAALSGLKAVTDEAGRLRHALIADMLDHARAIVEGGAVDTTLRSAGTRTVEALTLAYFDDDRIQRDRAPSTLSAYRSMAKRLVAKFGGRPVAQLTRRNLMEWYEDELLEDLTVATANLCIGATAAFLRWAHDKEWIVASPADRLGLRSATGRLVFWTIEDERAFVNWCDANGYTDIGDGITAGLWTGARIGDICSATLEDMAGQVWRFTPEKTRRKQQEAMPAIMAPLRARLDRRAIDARRGPRFLNATPFLWDHRTQRRYTANTFGHRFREARTAFVASGEATDGFGVKRTQDTRDTCITRLFLADVQISRMWTWTGHSSKSIERILRDHYIVLREEGAMQLAGKLATWAEKEGVPLGNA